MSPDIVVHVASRVYSVDRGFIWFTGRVSQGPRRLVGRRAVIRMTDDTADQLAADLLSVLTARRARAPRRNGNPDR